MNVSIIMVSYNTRLLTLDAIQAVYDSIERPDFSFEIILVDNASHDGSADAVRERFPDVRVIGLRENVGFGRGNNVGAEYAQGEALLLLNTDTVMHKGSIERLFEKMSNDDTVGIVGAKLEDTSGTFQYDSRLSYITLWRVFCLSFSLDNAFPNVKLFSDTFMRYADPNLEMDVDAVNGAMLMVRRSVFRQIQGFDPVFFMYCEEIDLCKRVSDLGFRIVYLPSASTTHIVGGSSKSKSHWVFKQIRRSRVLYARKHLGLLPAALMPVISLTANVIKIPVLFTLGIFNEHRRDVAKKELFSYFKN